MLHEEASSILMKMTLAVEVANSLTDWGWAGKNTISMRRFKSRQFRKGNSSLIYLYCHLGFLIGVICKSLSELGRM